MEPALTAFVLRARVPGKSIRTVPILPEVNGRVSEVRVDFSAPVKKGDVIFKLDSAKQEAAMETARRKIAEVDADLLAAQADSRRLAPPTAYPSPVSR
jgi:multidrug resistance efflux pump